MLTYYRDLNNELTQHNQRMRMELNCYRNEMIKLRGDLMKQREENALLKKTLTSEFLKVSHSFNIIFKLLENTCNESLNETIGSLNNSISKLDNTNYVEEANKIESTVTSHRRDNIGTMPAIGKDSVSMNDASLSNFSFEIENEEDITTADSVDMNISGTEEPANHETYDNFPQNNENLTSESNVDKSAMSIIIEESEEMNIEPTIRCDNEFHNSAALTDSSVNEESFLMPSKQGIFRSTTIPTDTISPSKIPLRNCSVLLTSIKIESPIVNTRRSTLNNVTPNRVSIKNEKQSLSSKENVNSNQNVEINPQPDKKIVRKQKLPKSPDKVNTSPDNINCPKRRLPARKAAPKVLVEQNNRTKMRR